MHTNIANENYHYFMKRTFTLFAVVFNIYGTSLAQSDDARLITIPVIFHVIYIDTLLDNGMSDSVRNSLSGNSTTRVPREKIIAELKDLDQDFQHLNLDLAEVIPEYREVVGDPKIHFVLRDIRYVQTTSAEIHQRNNSSKFRQLDPMVDPESCLNVYVSALRVKGGGSEGMTITPSMEVDLVNDGVNLNYSWVGLHYRLLTHEVGHWLGLWHVDNKDQITSGITDIPVQNTLTDIDCVKCTKPGVVVISQQRNKFRDANTNNFMDYSGCRRMFSIQQSEYMRRLVLRLRPQIWANSINR